jgi:hypothetical protein
MKPLLRAKRTVCAKLEFEFSGWWPFAGRWLFLDFRGNGCGLLCMEALELAAPSGTLSGSVSAMLQLQRPSSAQQPT